MRLQEAFLAGVFIAVLSASLLPGQQEDWQTKAGGKRAFEVASVRPDTGPFRPPLFALDAGDAFAQTNGRFSGDFALPTYISFAYKLSLTTEQRETMLARLPKWVTEDRFDIQAKAPNERATKDQMRLMMQALLAERFKLAAHFETHEVPVFTLELDKPGTLGPKLRPHAEGQPCDAPPPPGVFPGRCNLMASDFKTLGSRDTTLSLMADALATAGRLGRPVIDRTGLSGRFDFTFEWSPDTDTQAPSFPTALREQLGLKLTSAKAPIQLLVVDQVERPGEN